VPSMALTMLRCHAVAAQVAFEKANFETSFFTF
jgi:hypothetical protein